MSIWNIFSLAGGLAVFLYGMMEMNKHLTSIAGSRMKSVMLTLTKSPFRGYLTGLGITIVNQSSSATTVLEAALVGAGLMTFGQSIAVTLGAELGSTFLPQLVAFPAITKFASLFIAIGFCLLLVAKTAKRRHIAKTVLTFGLLFLGMDMMSASLSPLRSYEPFLHLMEGIEHPLAGMLIGIVFTMIIQSSGATTGITIAMAIAGAITLEQAVPINLGAAIGTCITAVLGSLTLNWEAKRSAYIHIMFQLIGSLWVLILLFIPFQGERLYIWFIKWFTLNVFSTEDPARQIAMGFTFMPLINHIILLPNLKHVLALFNRIVPERELPKPFGPKYINESLIKNSVELSLMMTRKEILYAASFVNQMIMEMKDAFRSKQPDTLERISVLDSKVDRLHKAIIPFLAHLSQEELTAKQSELCIRFLHIQHEIESIGDVIDKNIRILAVKKIEKNLLFSADGFHELEHLIYKIKYNFEHVLSALADDDITAARKIIDSYTWKEEEKYTELHIERLYKGQVESITTSSVHLDLITYFSQINGHIVYIAERIVDGELVQGTT